MREQIINTFYRPEQVAHSRMAESFSKSPLKPALVMEGIRRSSMSDMFFTQGAFPPFDRREFLLAHTQHYVRDFFAGKPPLSLSNGLPWSSELADAVRYTNSSLYHAVRESILHPERISFSPTSGFHHATPERGHGFCTFSGQVIASSKLFDELGVSGAWFDLDAHFGNSIEDSRAFVPNLLDAIPPGCNVNPAGTHRAYIRDFQQHLDRIGALVLSGQIHYVVFCHGADSHELDDTGVGQCTTEEWLECSDIFYQWVNTIDRHREKPLPLTLALFGGYRADNYQTVIDLHLSDLAVGVDVLLKRRGVPRL